jgi:hypothetical protein
VCVGVGSDTGTAVVKRHRNENMPHPKSDADDSEVPNLNDFEDWEQKREVFAWAGRAIYYAQVFEQSVVNTLYIGQLIDGSLATNFSSADEFHAVIEKQTAGQVTKQLRRHLELSHELDVTLTNALNRRNFLAHRFFVERVELFMHQEGRQLMLGELHQAIQLFVDADRQLEAVMFSHSEKFGLTSELAVKMVNALMAEAGPGGRSAAAIAEEIMGAAGYSRQQSTD